MSIVRPCFLISVALVVPALACAATPTIGSTSGPIANGEVLTIQGSSLTDENRTGWDPLFSGTAYGFEGSSLTTDGYTGYGGASYDTAVKLSGGKSMRFTAAGTHFCNTAHSNAECNPRSSGLIYPSLKGDWYARAYVRWDTNTWPGDQYDSVSGGWLKMIWAPNGSGGAYVIEPATSGGGTSGPSQFRGGGNAYAAVSYWKNAFGTLTTGRWYCIEMHGRTSGAAVFEAWIDGQKVASETPSTNLSGKWFEFGIINLNATPTSFAMNHYWDNFALSSSRVFPSAVVEIGTTADYATATKRYQSPILLENDRIQVKADLTGLGSGPYYLWITNNRQERSQAYLVGQGGGSVLPPPPNLRITQ